MATRARDTTTGLGRRSATTTWGTPASGVRRAAHAPASPTRVGHYRLVRELGRGGMGVVHEAEHELLGRRVALKLLARGRPDELARRRARFVEEARTAARLRHPAIVGVLDAGEDQGQLYLVMDLVRGETLADRLDREGALAPEVACALLLPVVDALAHAHRERIVHRDVKPANVLLEGDRALLADFGLACDLFRTDERSPAARPMGTISHMAPEQLRGEPASPASDVWAMGVTLYECLTDRLPWPVHDVHDLEAFARAQAASAPAPVRALAPRVGPALEQVVLRCLAPRPEERFADAGALLAALEAARPWAAADAACGGEAGAPPTRRIARLRARLVAAVGLAAGVVAGAVTTHLVSRLVSGERARRGPPAVEDPRPAEGSPGAGPAA